MNRSGKEISSGIYDHDLKRCFAFRSRREALLVVPSVQKRHADEVIMSPDKPTAAAGMKVIER